MAGAAGRGGGKGGKVELLTEPRDEGGGADSTEGGEDEWEEVTVEEGTAVGMLAYLLGGAGEEDGKGGGYGCGEVGG